MSHNAWKYKPRRMIPVDDHEERIRWKVWGWIGAVLVSSAMWVGIIAGIMAAVS
ncbi:hypothetical protein [Gorillibacterium sp. sgz500922]|uniref:hypothetical protein n=1 Tax=Gorillibacterium sp. sgz500922 TaxID=3446694 RepID=UPI003F668196